MKSKEEWQDLTDEEIDKEIKIRYDLMSQMVGWLYPSIIGDEIGALHEIKGDPLRKTRSLVNKQLEK